MIALRYRAPWEIEFGSGPDLEVPGFGEVRVRIRATGICGTDLAILCGDYPARPGVVLGHEFAGEVEEMGSGVSGLAVGDRVVVDPTYHCGACRMCRTRRPNHCVAKSTREAGVSADGAFTEAFLADVRCVHRIADHLSFEVASLAEPLSCALTGVDLLRVRGDLDVVIAGAGPMGMLYSYALASRGVVGALIETAPARRELAVVAAPRGWEVHADFRYAAGSIDILVDTAGVDLARLIPCIRRGGRVLFVSLTGRQQPIDPSEITDRSLQLIGSIDSIETFGLAVRMLESGAVPGGRLITSQLPLNEYARAFETLGVSITERCRRQADVSAIKVVLTG